jgi:S1-C subfamily serine protease
MSLIHATTPPSLPPFPSLSHPTSGSGNERDRGRNTVDAVKAAAPAVVKVMRTNGTSGSGFVISEDGWVVTNEHVIAKMAEGEIITISLNSGRDFVARNFVAKVRKSSSSFLHEDEDSWV